MLEVLECHWGEDLTGNNPVKELFSVLGEGVPCDHHAKMKCFCRFAKYFINVTLAFITKIDPIYNCNLNNVMLCTTFLFPLSQRAD